MPDDKKMRAEWHRAPDFAEFAEALGIMASLVLSVRDPQGDEPHVLYTLSPESTLLHSVLLRRGTDGVLFVASEPIPLPGMWEKIIEDAERDQ